MSPKRKEIERIGRKRRGGISVRVVAEVTRTGSRVRVLWLDRVTRRPRCESYPHTRDGKAAAIAFAEGLYQALVAPAVSATPALPRCTIGELWTAYATAEFPAQRPASRVTLRNRWRKFELFAGADAVAQMVTREKLDAFCVALREAKHAPNQIAEHVRAARLVFRWGVDRDLIPPNKVTGYRAKLSKDERRQGPVMREFRSGDVARLLGGWDPRSARDWRPWVLTTLLAFSGPRQLSARSLVWPDVDFAAETIRWAPETDKTAHERVQPMPAPVREALWVAYGWRLADGYAGPFVFYRPGAGVTDRSTGARSTRQARRDANKPDAPWSYAAYNGRLATACTALGVERAKYQAAHAFRRGVAGNVLALTGSVKDAATYIGDKSTKVVEKHYLIERSDSMRDVADRLGIAPEGAPTGPAITQPNATSAEQGAREETLGHE